MQSIIEFILRLIFTYIVYPLIILTILFVIFVILYSLIINGQRGIDKLRRFSGALPPMLIMIYSIVSSGEVYGGVYLGILNSSLVQNLGGFLAGICLIEVGTWTRNPDSEIAAALYALFLSSTAC